MLGLRKQWFKTAIKLAKKINRDRSDLETLVKLQHFIISRIIFCEKSSPALKNRLKILEESGRLETDQYKSISYRLEQYRQSSYVWRCFGDMIAFMYMDSFALKQVYYNTHNRNPKQSSGFIGGKSGIDNEVQALAELSKRQIPAILTDLTNTIRHGDLCIMVGPDPHLLEIKSSNKLDRRGRKQNKRISALTDFFAKDHAADLRGFQNITRRIAPKKTQYHDEMFTSCICKALEKGYHVEIPESGLYYVAISDQNQKLDDILGKIRPANPWLFQLNEIKNAKNWAPYIPFTLTIGDQKALWSFIKGNVVAFVLFDVEQINILADKFGFDCNFSKDEVDFPLELVRRSDGQNVRGSWHILSRIGIEMLSIEWFVSTMVDALASSGQKSEI